MTFEYTTLDAELAALINPIFNYDLIMIMKFLLANYMYMCEVKKYI